MRDKKRLTLTHRRGGPDTAHAIANIDLIETMRTRVSQTLGALSRPDTGLPVHTHMQGRTGPWDRAQGDGHTYRLETQHTKNRQ
jgi:hypothetical protein